MNEEEVLKAESEKPENNILKEKPSVASRIKGYFLIKLFQWRNRPARVLIHPNRKLKRIAKEVDFTKTSKDKLVKILRKMHGTLISQKYGQRLGLAAPQIGINKRIIIVRGVVLINPEFIPTKAPKNDIIEGCYSVPNKVYKVSRAKYGWCRWYSIDGELREYRVKGLEAIVLQHEIDHLDGKCCVDIGEEVKA